ncbi:MAG: polysaccharide deacetylase family protein [Chitinophagaceae bacterium]|nr:polysaccharide deacetylase family protein [Chitinophagaceae bacterium]
MFYLVKTPFLIRALRSSYIWKINTEDKLLHLTFDDGPHETATPYVLDQLKYFNAKATFFCLGKNVAAHPAIYSRIIDEGHAVGNHTYDHLNGWKTSDKNYLENIAKAAGYIDSNLFRPPYGRISLFQGRALQKGMHGTKYRVVMWDVLSGDFDITLNKEKCLQNVLLNAEAGSVIVFHDSAKAWERLEYVLPKTLEHFSEKGYRFEKL